MPLSKDRIIALGTTPYLHEQSAINFVLSALPDQDPFRLWGLIDLVDPGGRRYDIDLLIIGYHALYLIEIKSHPGRIKGDVVDWDVTFPDGGRTTLPHPGRLVEHKAGARACEFAGQADVARESAGAVGSAPGVFVGRERQDRSAGCGGQPCGHARKPGEGAADRRVPGRNIPGDPQPD